jgi:phage shock protein PspC (stress-responsive transcriptional regulator)
MTSAPPSSGLPVALSRAASGRWLGGVCAGLARFRELPVGWVRAVFVLMAAVGGLGLLVYLACWLIIPAEGEHADERPRGIVVLAQACAACAGLATLAAVGTAATIFGFGWVVVVAAAAVLAMSLAWWPRVGPAWTLLPIAALALPSVAVAAGGLRLAAQTGNVRVAPGALADVPQGGYRSGLGMLLIDLRHTAIPVAGTVPLRIDAGIRRTLVALPHDRCVHVDVNYHVVPFAARVAGVLTGRPDYPFPEVVVFGMQHFAGSGIARNLDPRLAGPTLKIDFTSAGGSLYVRDYPETVDPGSEPNWPGYQVSPEPPPDTTGMPRRSARELLRHWRVRHRAQVRSARHVDGLIPGPCGAKGRAA